jgi:hypothetical protein
MSSLILRNLGLIFVKQSIIYTFVKNEYLKNMAKQQQQPEENQINVELSEEMAEGEYVNLAMIAHSQSEFVIDFIKMMPGLPKARVKSRVIITPDHAYRLLNALKENIQRYEEAYGAIAEDQGQIGFQFPMPYRGPIGEA